LKTHGNASLWRGAERWSWLALFAFLMEKKTIQLVDENSPFEAFQNAKTEIHIGHSLFLNSGDNDNYNVDYYG
jgi:hypothetical protein